MPERVLKLLFARYAEMIDWIQITFNFNKEEIFDENVHPTISYAIKNALIFQTYIKDATFLIKMLHLAYTIYIVCPWKNLTPFFKKS